LLDMPGDAEELRPGVVLTAEAGEPRPAAAQDLGRRRDRLDIVDGGRATIEPGHRRERRLQPRLPLLALETLDEGRLLAADIGAGAAMEIEVEVPAAAAGVLAYQARFIGLIDGGLEIHRLLIELA